MCMTKTNIVMKCVDERGEMLITMYIFCTLLAICMFNYL